MRYIKKIKNDDVILEYELKNTILFYKKEDIWKYQHIYMFIGINCIEMKEMVGFHKYDTKINRMNLQIDTIYLLDTGKKIVK
jgi:hypothetical protein